MKLPLLLGCALLASCSSGPLATRVKTSSLSRAPIEVTAPVNSARSEAEVARDAWTNATDLTRSTEKAVTLARRELAVVVERVDQARRAAVAAERKGTPEEAAAAKDVYQDLLNTAEIARLGLSLAKREYEVAVLRELVALEESGLADARLELATGRAVESLDLPASAAVALADLRGQERLALREVERANQRLSSARVAQEWAREAYDGAIAAVREMEAGRR